MAETGEKAFPLKKRRFALAFHPPKSEEQQKPPIPVFSSYTHKTLPSLNQDRCFNNGDFPWPRPTKRVCTEIRDSESKPQKESTDYLWGLFHYICDDSEEEEGQLRVFGSFVPGKNAAMEKNKKKKKQQRWWKSMVGLGLDKLRREKIRHRLSKFWKREQELKWEIEHKQDPFAILSLPVSTSFRI